ncbi:hypothetical protein OCOL_001540 [Ordospora colligata]|uniref:Uncharacterized protein n=1 Tax=Ordospora colligata OC4 TaxID=1354746 RepID=A0A0B2UM15_9MICR|nr:uncharacterized protein M896_021220 [Ordospora colligata OC4]KHN70284.1 hypothetical protein M896_021220 [Ordospora colligata OC4]TBU16828.1 hypothetical protein CWI41_021230 [Ordospora colligata]
MILRLGAQYTSKSVVELFEHLKADEDLLLGIEEPLECLIAQSNDPEYVLEVMHKTDTELITVCIKSLDFKIDADITNLELVILKAVSNVLGYQCTMMHGFVVKDSNGIKTRPIIPIFFRYTLGVSVTDYITYVKEEETEVNEVEQVRLIRCFCMGPIMTCLLRSRAMRFTCDEIGTSVVLMQRDGVIFMAPSSISVVSMVHSTVSLVNMEMFLKHLRKFPFRLVDFFVNAYLEPDSAESSKRLSECFAELQDNLTKLEMKCICSILSNAPVFLDSRDKVTERIEKFYAYNAKPFRRDGGKYLSFKEEEFVDRHPIGSLKRYFKDL